MSLRVWSAALAAAVLAGVPSAAQRTGRYSDEPAAMALLAKSKKSVGAVRVFDGKRKLMGGGSGFFISGKHFVTNCHVIEQAHDAVVATPAGGSFPVLGVAAANRGADLALLLVGPSGTEPVPLQIAAEPPEAGERLLAVAAPLSHSGRAAAFTITEGALLKIHEIQGGRRLIQSTTPVREGFSGGPLMNYRGEVVGINTSYVRDIEKAGTGTFFAVAAGHLAQLKPGKPVPLAEWAQSARENPPTEKDMGALMQTVLAEQWLEKDPDNARILANLASKYIELEEYEKAIAPLERANRLKPAAANYAMLGTAHSMLGDFEGGVRSLETAREMDPKEAGIHYSLADAYRHLDRLSDAEQSYKEAIRLKADFHQARYDLARLYLETGREEAAREEYRHLKAADCALAEKLLEAIEGK